MTELVIVDVSTGEERMYALTEAELAARAQDAAADEEKAAARPPSVAERLAAVEARLDKAAAASVTGEAAKLRDNLKPTG